MQSIAASVALVMGLRASEICGLTVRCFDDGGTVLAVVKGKTARSIRRVRIPNSLRPRIAELCEGKMPGENIFGDLTRHGLHHHVNRLCKLAGVPIVCTHGLRGTMSTTAVNLGVDLGLVADAMGHTSTSITERHYLAPGTKESARADRAELLLSEPTDLVMVPSEPLPPSETEGPDIN